jgi:hypothetical protein
VAAESWQAVPMKPLCLFLGLLGCLFAGCKSPDAEYGDFGIFMLGLASYPVTGYETVKSGLMKHVYAAPGTTYPDFEAAIEKVEKINSVPATFSSSPNFATDHSYLFRYEGRKTVYYGRFVKVANDESEFVQTFSAGEITNLTSFVVRLKTSSDPVSAFLVSRFSESNRLAVAGFPESGMDEKALEPRLVEELNAIVLGPSIYDTDRFRGVTLRPAILPLLKFSFNTRPETSLRRQQLLPVLNRMLLADAYTANLPMKSWIRMQNYVTIKY